MIVSMNMLAQTSGLQLDPGIVVPKLAAVIKAPNTAILSSQSEGLIKKVHVQEGDSFKKDDLLLSLDCTLQQANLDKAQAHYNYAAKDYNSIKSLAELNSASEMQIVRSKSEFNKAAAEVRTSEYHVQYCYILAPYDGSVVTRWANPHENIDAKGKLFEIVSNNGLVAEFLAPSTMLTSLKPGMAIELKVNETRQSYGATVARIVPHIDSISQTIKAVSYTHLTLPTTPYV